MNILQKTYKKEIEELVEACHRCAELNYVTSSGGNLSLRLTITNTSTTEPVVMLKHFAENPELEVE